MKERYIREILSGFPYPITAYFTKLGTDECLDPGPLRLKYLLATGEAVGRFLGVVVLAEVRDRLEEPGAPSLPASLVSDFAKRYRSPSWGNWLHFAREGLKWLSLGGVSLVMPELTGFYFGKFPAESEAAEALGKMLTLRNGLSHERIRAMTGREFQGLCEEAEPLLEAVLTALAFLPDHELVFVSRIEVTKRRRTPASFLHRLSRIVGDSSDFRGDRKTLPRYLDPGCILLEGEGERLLNLDPFLVYEPSAGKAPDVFFYDGFKRAGSAEYVACNHGGGFGSAAAERGGELWEEAAYLLRLVTGEAPGQGA
ncbi:MAG: hypothetical protein KA419_08955 [Acidobacteria bacterium]|nr:hypothetical protein [Acidobacteriota bacterium]